MTQEDTFNILREVYDFLPTSVPTRENYKQWYAWRVQRTKKAMAASNNIKGEQIKDENLSMMILEQNGYRLDAATDTMVKR